MKLVRCSAAGSEYSFTDSYNHTTSFNICGYTSQICANPWMMYNSIGTAVMSWGTAPTPCDNSCTNWDTYEPTCCTAPCEVLSHGILAIPTGGSAKPFHRRGQVCVCASLRYVRPQMQKCPLWNSFIFHYIHPASVAVWMTLTRAQRILYLDWGYPGL
jgi:hypothetical protein